MISPASILIDSIASLLSEGRNGIPAIFPVDGDIPIYRGDEPECVDPPFVNINQDGDAKERHLQGHGLWEIPVFVFLILDRNGAIGDTPDDVAATAKSYLDDIEAALTRNLLLDAEDAEAGFTTPEERLSDGTVHVWEIYDVSVSAPAEVDGHLNCEVKFTAFCTQASRIIPADE